MQDNDLLFRLLRQVDVAPDAPQRAAAGALGISVGRLNGVLRQAIEAGLIR
ncbi:MAG: winged helix-turn-helix transcriptional regulator, partial [Planktomarina sp.]